MIRHIVALRFRQGVTQAEKDALSAELGALRNHIDGILDYRSFPNISIEEPVVHGFRDVFWFDFRDDSVRDVYLADATHQAIGARIVDKCEGGPDGILVMDVEL